MRKRKPSVEMSTADSFVSGIVFYSGTLAQLAELLAQHNLHATVGPWALRLSEPPCRFKIAYVGNITPDEPFEVEVDGYAVPHDVVAGWCERVADCLRANGIRFEMTHFNGDEQEIRHYRAAS